MDGIWLKFVKAIREDLSSSINQISVRIGMAGRTLIRYIDIDILKKKGHIERMEASAMGIGKSTSNSDLKFSPVVETAIKQVADNPKRRSRNARKQVKNIGIGTKSQHALKLQQEESKVEHRQISKEQRDTEKQRQFELKQQKRREKHRGH